MVYAVCARHLLFERRQVLEPRPAPRLVDGLGRAGSRDHVLALGVLQVLAVEDLFSCARVARERDARRTIVAHVAKHHGLHVHRGAQRVGNAVQVPIPDGALVVPGAEDRADGPPELLLRVLREGLPRPRPHDLEVLLRHALQILRTEIRVGRCAARVPHALEATLEALVGNPKHHVAIHLNEAPVAVVGEALTGEPREAFHRFLAEPQVQDRIHHARHRDRGARADRDQQGALGISEACLHDALDARQRPAGLLANRLRDAHAGANVLVAERGGERESRRHRDAEMRHLGEIRPLPPQEIAHRGAAVRAPSAEEVDAPRGLSCLRPRGPSCLRPLGPSRLRSPGRHRDSPTRSAR
jgi:hypothetical protein